VGGFMLAKLAGMIFDKTRPSPLTLPISVPRACWF